jgi:hypothetical protein
MYLRTISFESPSRLRRIETEAFDSCASLDMICIPACVEILGSRCFHCCLMLMSTVFETGSTLRSIESEAFDNCISMSAITIPPCIELLSPSWHIRSSIKIVKFEGLKCLRQMMEAGSLEMNAREAALQIQVKLMEGDTESDAVFADHRITVLRD